jgi:hypothetical protein
VPGPVAVPNEQPEPNAQPVVAVTEEAKGADAEALKAKEAEREAVYRGVLPRKPETAFAMWEGTPHDVAVPEAGGSASVINTILGLIPTGN